MKRRTFITAAVGAAALAAGGGYWWRHRRRGGRKAVAKSHPTRSDLPNIIILLIDDLGYGDVGYQPDALPDVKTPNIDALAKSGTWCPSAYVCSPVCSPSRAGMLTGMYPQRFGMEFNVGIIRDPAKPPGLPTDVPLLSERLQNIGYTTGWIGKWHLGAAKQFRPNSRGFDEAFGFYPGSRSYWGKFKKNAIPMFHNDERIEEKEYLTDAFAREAENFIGNHKDKSFFLYLPFNAVHSPHEEPPAKYMEPFKSVSEADRRSMLGTIAAVDDAIGRVMAKLKSCGLSEKTLVFCLSDNGGTGGEGSHNGSLRRGKGSTFEGGVRIPFAATWPGKIPAGRFDGTVSALDITATALAAAGVKADGLDGVDLLPFFSGKSQGSPHETLYWRYGDRLGIRKGKWKWADNAELGKGLFDLEKDIDEKDDVSEKNPQIAKDLQADFAAWASKMKPPAWDMPKVKGPDDEKDE